MIYIWQQIFSVDCLEVSCVGQLLHEIVKQKYAYMYFSHPILICGVARIVIPVVSTWRDNELPLVVVDTTIVTCRLSSIPKTYIYFAPLDFHVMSSLLGATWQTSLVCIYNQLGWNGIYFDQIANCIAMSFPWCSSLQPMTNKITLRLVRGQPTHPFDAPSCLYSCGYIRR